MDRDFESVGKLTCNKTILYSIVSLATKEIKGVVGLSKKAPSAKKFFGKGADGIRIEYNNAGQLLVDIFVDVYSDISAPDLCFKVQENVRNSILSMVDVKAEKVNVHIVDVIIKKDVIENESAV